MLFLLSVAYASAHPCAEVNVKHLPNLFCYWLTAKSSTRWRAQDVTRTIHNLCSSHNSALSRNALIFAKFSQQQQKAAPSLHGPPSHHWEESVSCIRKSLPTTWHIVRFFLAPLMSLDATWMTHQKALVMGSGKNNAFLREKYCKIETIPKKLFKKVSFYPCFSQRLNRDKSIKYITKTTSLHCEYILVCSGRVSVLSAAMLSRQQNR